jgi:hypothetical protein
MAQRAFQARVPTLERFERAGGMEKFDPSEIVE